MELKQCVKIISILQYLSSPKKVFIIKKIMFQVHNVSDQESAAILASFGLEAENNESDEQLLKKCQKVYEQRDHPLSKLEVDHLRKNIVSIRAKLKEKITVRNVLCGVGHVAKWAYTLHQCVSKANGWFSLVGKTATFGPTQIAAYSFGRSIASKSMWWVTAIIATYEVGCQFKKWYNQQISTKQFWVNAGKTLAVSVLSAAGGACGAYVGAALGMACGGPVGAIIGCIVGGFSGSVASSYGTQKLIEYSDTKYQQYTANQLIKTALEVLQLPSKCSLTTLQSCRKTKFMQYHPDRWLGEKKERRQEMARKLQQAMESYEILKNALESQFEAKKKKAIKFYKLTAQVPPEELEACYKKKLQFYDASKWVAEDQDKKQRMALKLKKTKQYYEIMKNNLKTDLKLGE